MHFLGCVLKILSQIKLKLQVINFGFEQQIIYGNQLIQSRLKSVNE